MQNLLKFLARNGVFLVFIGLEFLCLNLVIRNNQRQAEIYHKTSTAFTAGLHKRINSAADYWDLRTVNDSLRLENSRLRTALINRIATTSARQDSGALRKRFDVIPASVIQNSISRRNNYLTLDKGADSGIEPDMGVISASGPVGIVIAATPGYSKVMSLLHSNTMLSASIRSKGFLGSLVWKSSDPRRMELEAIPKHATLAIGDTVVTSGFSRIFPPDITIGTVDTFWLPRGSNFFRARVALEVELDVLHSAYVIVDHAREELDSLETLDLQ